MFFMGGGLVILATRDDEVLFGHLGEQPRALAHRVGREGDLHAELREILATWRIVVP